MPELVLQYPWADLSLRSWGRQLAGQCLCSQTTVIKNTTHPSTRGFVCQSFGSVGHTSVTMSSWLPTEESPVHPFLAPTVSSGSQRDPYKTYIRPGVSLLKNHRILSHLEQNPRPQPWLTPPPNFFRHFPPQPASCQPPCSFLILHPDMPVSCLPPSLPQVCAQRGPLSSLLPERATNTAPSVPVPLSP